MLRRYVLDDAAGDSLLDQGNDVTYPIGSRDEFDDLAFADSEAVEHLEQQRSPFAFIRPRPQVYRCFFFISGTLPGQIRLKLRRQGRLRSAAGWHVLSMEGKQEPSEATRDLAEGRWRGVYWYMSQDIKRRYGPTACAPPPPGTPRRSVRPPHGDCDLA